MSGETTNFKFKYAEAADEVNKFPVNVDEPKTKEIDKVLFERTLTIKKRAASYEAVSGEWGIQEKTAETTTLPAATANRIVGVFSTVAEAKITTSGGAFIEGDFITAVSKTGTIILTTGQHVVLIANGTNWEIVAGEPKRETKWTALATITGGVEQEPSATRPTLVMLQAERTVSEGIVSIRPEVGGVALPQLTTGNVPSGTDWSLTFEVPAGVKWVVPAAANNVFKVSYLTR